MEKQQKTKRFTKPEWSWILYDWANSAYTIVVTTVVLPLFFADVTLKAGVSDVNSNAYWGYANSIAGLLVAVAALFLGSLSDYKGWRSKFFKLFFFVGVGTTILLSLTNNWLMMLIIYALTVVGFNGSLAFYDAFLPDVTTTARMDKVSSWGFGMGYIGGSTIPFILSIALIQFGEGFGIPLELAYRISFLIAAVWWLLFTIPMLKNVRQTTGYDPEKGAIRKSLARLGHTIKDAVKNKNMVVFLIAYFFYIDGVGTIIKMATKYSLSMGIGKTDIIIAMLMVQVIAFPCAIFFGRLAGKLGTRTMIFGGIGVYFGVCVVGFYMHSALELYILAALVGTSQGGIQALSRSFFGKLIPDKNKSGEYFGMYNIFGKFEAIMGTALMGVVTQLTGKANYGVLSVMVTFAVGAVLLLFVKSPKVESERV